MKFLLTGEESERLFFRNLEENDFNWWLEFTSNSEAVRFFDFTKNLDSKEICQLWFNKVFERYEKNTGGHNVLVEKQTGKSVGMCGLLIQEVDGKEEFEIGYSVHPDYWNLGFASEAARKCRDFAFENGFTNSLISIVHIENSASAKVAMKNKMKLDKQTVYKGIPVNIFRINGEFYQSS